MPWLWTILVSCALLVKLVKGVHEIDLKVYHRLLVPEARGAPWIFRGHFDKDHWIPSSNFLTDLKRLTDDAQAQDSRSLYQVALERPGDGSSNDWDFVSVKACYLRSSPVEQFVLHSKDQSVYGLSYSIIPIFPDGACHTSLTTLTNLSTVVLTSFPARPSITELRKPPPLDPQGQVIKPPPEKSFLQKYWVYFVLLFLVISFTGGGDEPQPVRS